MRESEFQKEVIEDLKERLEGCVVIKTDPRYIQGLPDLLILWNDLWVALEVKRSEKASLQPNQRWWVDHLNEMSYASIITPETKEEVLDEIQYTLGVDW